MKKHYIAIIFALTTMLSFGQFAPDYSQNFHTQETYWNNYYDSLRAARLANGDSSMSGTGFGQFTEWLYNWKHYVPNSGDFQDAFRNYRDLYNQQRYSHVVSQQLPPPNTLIVPAEEWTEIGPNKFSTIQGLNTTWYNPHSSGINDFSFAGHVGRFDRLYKHPTEVNTLYTYGGNPDNYSAGGLFKTTDGGLTWNIVQGVDFIPNSMIAAFVVKPIGVNPSPGVEIMFIGLASGAVYRSTDGGTTWIESEYNGTVSFPPNFGSNIPANSITNVFDITNSPFPPQPIENLNFKFSMVYTYSIPNAYARILVCREGGLYYSDNYDAVQTHSGNTITNGIIWSRFTSIDGLFTSANIPYLHPSATSNHVLAVTDIEQFTQSYTTYLVAHVSRKELSSNNDVRAVRSYIIYSIDDGVTWTLLGSPLVLPNGYINSNYSPVVGNGNFSEANIEVISNSPKYVYVSYTRNVGGGYTLYRYEFATQLWTDLSSSSGSQLLTPFAHCFAINPNDEDEYWQFTNFYTHVKYGSVWNSYNDGSNIKRHTDTRDILVIDDLNQFIATDGGIYKSTNAGDTWFPMSEGLGGANTGSVSVSQQPPYYVGAGFWHSGFQIYNPEDEVWHWNPYIYDGSGGSFSFLDNQVYSAFHFGPGIGSSDYLTVFRNFDLLNTNFIYQASDPAWSENIDGLGFVGINNVLHRTTDNFATYTPVSIPNLSYTSIYSVFDIPNDKDRFIIYDGAGGKIYFIENATTTPSYNGDFVDLNAEFFNLSGSTSEADLYHSRSIEFDPNNPERYFIIFNSVANWNDPTDGRIAEYDPVSNSFIDITYRTDDVLYGNPVTEFPNYIAIREIVMDRQTGILYIGTTNGVYYLDNDNQIWRKYSQNVPFLYSDLEIVHCTGEMYSSSHFRGIWKAPTIRDNIDTRDWVISQNTTWTDRINLFCTLIVKPGVTLTVQNELVVYGDQRIIVEQGGTLILNGATVTIECGDFWQGIEVWGDRTKHQYPVNGDYYQGRLIMQNNAVLEYAREGIVLFNPNDGTNGYNTSGGIVQASNSTIRNVKRGAQFISYKNIHPSTQMEVDNLSSFIQCTFELTEALPENEDPNAFVTMWDVRGVKFKGCTFQNTNPNPGNPNKTGRGIYTENANFTVQEQCLVYGQNGCISFVPSNFEDLWVGVWSARVGGKNSFIVKNSDFTNCQIGSIVDGVSNMQITGNDFIVGDHPTGGSTVHVGLNLANAITGYTIENNTFTEPSGSASTNTFGIWSYNTGTNNKVIRKNSFDNMFIGLDAEKLNREPLSGLTGLQFECNTHTDGDYDFFITDGTIQNNGYGIRKEQGSGSVPAGNIFSNNGNVPVDGDYYNISSNQIRYYYYTGNTQEDPQDYSVLNVNKVGVPNENDNCGTTGGGGGEEKSLATLTLEYLDADQHYQNYKTMMQSLIDGGNTPGLKIDVTTSTTNETAALRLELLGKSPYLSEEVLKTAADKTNVLPEAILFEILMANPDALYSNDLMQYLEDKSSPLPQWMLDILEATRGQITMRTLLESAMGYYGSTRSEKIKNIITLYENTDSLFNEQEIRGWYALYNDYQADYSVVESFVREGNYSAADDYLGTISTSHTLKEWQVADLDNYTQFMDFYIGMLQGGKHENQLDSGEVEQLRQIADLSDEYTGSMRARNILNFFYNYDYWIEPTLPTATPKNMSITTPANTDWKEHIDVYPVPATDWVSFSYQMKPGMKDGVLELINTTGTSVYQSKITVPSGVHVVDVSRLASGIYSYRISGNGGTVFSGTIVVN